MGITYPDAGWRAPDSEICVQDVYDGALRTYWSQWLASHGHADDLYAHVYAVMTSYGVDLHTRHWSDDRRPCARIYAVTKRQIVAALRAIWPAIYKGIDESDLARKVEGAVWWLYGRRRVQDPDNPTRRPWSITDDAPFVIIEYGRGSGRPRAGGRATGTPSSYILRLPDTMAPRGAATPDPGAAVPVSASVDIPSAARPSSVVGEPCLDVIIERHQQAEAKLHRAHAARYDRKLLAELCERLLAEGWSWSDIDRGHRAYLRDWRRTDETQEGRWFKRLRDVLAGTRSDHKTPDPAHDIRGYMHPAHPWPELAGVLITGSPAEGWRWRVIGDDTMPRGSIEGSVGITNEAEARAMFARWLYTNPSAVRYRTVIWDAAEAVAGKHLEASRLPDGVKIRRVNGSWEWAFAADLGTDYERWQPIWHTEGADESRAVAELLDWFATDQGAKALARGQQRAIHAAAERAMSRQAAASADSAAVQADDAPAMEAGLPDDAEVRKIDGVWRYRATAADAWHPMIGVSDETEARKRARQVLRDGGRYAAEAAPPADTTSSSGQDWGAQVASMAPYDKEEDIPF